MLKAIDKILNRISMYKIVLYSLSAWIFVALVLSFFHLLPFTPQALLYSTAVILTVCWVTNRAFVLVFKTHANVESVYITAFILALLITPPSAGEYVSVLPLLIWASIWSMSAKFIMACSCESRHRQTCQDPLPAKNRWNSQPVRTRLRILF